MDPQRQKVSSYARWSVCKFKNTEFLYFKEKRKKQTCLVWQGRQQHPPAVGARIRFTLRSEYNYGQMLIIRPSIQEGDGMNFHSGFHLGFMSRKSGIKGRVGHLLSVRTRIVTWALKKGNKAIVRELIYKAEAQSQGKWETRETT